MRTRSSYPAARTSLAISESSSSPGVPVQPVSPDVPVIAVTMPAICESESSAPFVKSLLSSLAKQHFDGFHPEPIELVDGAHRRESLFHRNVNAIHRTIENLAVVHLHDVAAARNPESLHCVSGEHAHLSVGCHRRGADSIRIKLHELPEASRTRLFVAEHPGEAIRAVWQCQILEILGHIACQRRRKVIAQREPLLVIVLEREDAFVGSVLIWEELAESVGIFDGRRLHRLKAVSLEHNANCLDHLTGRGDLRRPAIGEAARQARFELLGLAGLIGHLRVYISDGGITATLEPAAGGLVPVIHLFMLRRRSTGPPAPQPKG